MICSNCVTPGPLKAFISDVGSVATCAYCERAGISVDPKALFQYIYDRVEENTAGEKDLSSYEDVMIFDVKADITEVASIDVVLSEWLGVEDDLYFDALCGSVPATLSRNERNMDRLFFRDDGLLERNFYEDKWQAFVSGIRHSHRYFNPNAAEFLDSVFSFLTHAGKSLKPECVRLIAKGTPLYRARSVESYEDAKKIQSNPASQLGRTPKDKASNQRMTPNGISALYCALERETCLSEIRSITGDRVLSGAITPIREIALLDLTKLASVERPNLTLLDKRYLDTMHLKTFVDSLVKKMSTPKGRNDDLSYISTQVVFEYLRLRFADQVSGLVFPSVQTGEKGTNVVLFPEASVLSAKTYRPEHRELGPEFLPDDGSPFEDGAAFCFIESSIRFHKVKALVTEAAEYDVIGELFMSDLTKRQIGL